MRLYRWIPRRLSHQIFLVILGVVVIPLVILGSLLIRTSQKTMEATVNRDLKQIVLHATGEVLKEYEGAYHALDATAAILGTLHADSWRQETAVVELSLKYPSLRRICSVDLEGHPVACSGLGEQPDKVIPVNFDCVDRIDHCVSKVRSDNDHTPVMDMVVPVRRYGKIVGLLTAEYGLRGIWDVVDKIQFGPQSRAILVDQFGRILAHPDKKEVLKNNTFTDPQVIRDLERGKSGTRLIVDPEHHKWVVAYSPIPSLHWGLIVVQPYEEVFAFLTLMHYHSWLLVMFSVFAAGLIGFIVARWMSRPMDVIIAATRRLAQGDLSVSLSISRRDEIGRLKFAFNHMVSRLRNAREVERLSIVGKSAASIAHELKNSLVLVKTFVQLIPQRQKDRAFIREASETIVKELDGWNAMLLNIMDFAREQMPLHLSPVDINTLIEDATLLTKMKAESQQLRFHVQTFDSFPLIHADAVKIKQVIVNLIANAFDATPIGGEVSVRTFMTDRGGRTFVGFEVENTGEGIAEEHLSRIFDPFFTTKHSGLGLGLAICRDIVKKHKGHLDVVSIEGRGATFRAVFPVSITGLAEKDAYDFGENHCR